MDMDMRMQRKVRFHDMRLSFLVLLEKIKGF